MIVRVKGEIGDYEITNAKGKVEVFLLKGTEKHLLERNYQNVAQAYMGERHNFTRTPYVSKDGRDYEPVDWFEYSMSDGKYPTKTALVSIEIRRSV